MIPVETSCKTIYRARVPARSDVILRNDGKNNAGRGSVRDHLSITFGIMMIFWERLNALSRVKYQYIKNCFLYCSPYLRVFCTLMFVLYKELRSKIVKILIRQFHRILSLTPQHPLRPELLFRKWIELEKCYTERTLETSIAKKGYFLRVLK